MRRFILALVPALLLMATAVPAMASQPDSGANSQVRNPNGTNPPPATTTGPHCHVNLVASDAQDVFDFIAAYPSHMAHERTGLADGIFAGAAC